MQVRIQGGEYYIAIVIDNKIKVLLFNADSWFNIELKVIKRAEKALKNFVRGELEYGAGISGSVFIFYH